MKNKVFLILSMVALTVLAGCGENTSSNSGTSTSYRDADESDNKISDVDSSNNSTTVSSKKESSTSSSSGISITNLDELFTNLKTYKVNVINQKYTLGYYGKHAYYLNNVNYSGTTMASYEPYVGGMFSTDDNGTWSYNIKKGTYDKFTGETSDDEFELGSCQYGANIDFTDSVSYYKPLTSFLKSSSLWAQVKKTTISGAITEYAIKDETSSKAEALLDDLPSLARFFDGYTYSTGDDNSASITESSNITYKASDVALAFLKKNKVYLSFKIYIYEDGENTNKGYGGHVYLTDIGTASDPLLDTFLASPSFDAPTSWTTEEDDTFKNIIGESLPFVTGLTKGHTFDSETNAYGDKYEAVVTDVLCGESVASAYKTTLTNAGWNGVDAQLDSSYGFSTTYSKNGKSVSLVYLSSAYYAKVYDASTAALYPKGVLAIDACVYDSSSLSSIKDSYIDKYLSKTNLDGTTSDYIPDFDFGSYKPTEIEFYDYTTQGQTSYGSKVKCFYYIYGTFSTAADANAAIKNYLTKLSAAGFINPASTEDDPETFEESLDSSKTVYATLEDSSFTALSLSSKTGLHMIIAYGDAIKNNTDPGYFLIEIAG